jgi:DNA-binding transcriptional ArsR family regulator
MPVKKKKTKSKPPRNGPPEQEIYTLTDLEQVKTLSDPLRLRVLQALCVVERTTKQVAGILGEKPTKLYHHVDALERVGLVRLTRTRQNRGTIEKYYQSVARMFRTDPRLFEVAAPDEKARALSKMLSTVFDNTSLEMQHLMSLESGPRQLEEQGILSYAEVRASEERIRAVRETFEKLIKEMGETGKKTATGEKKTAGKKRRYRLTLAFFPIDLEEKEGSS